MKRVLTLSLIALLTLLVLVGCTTGASNDKPAEVTPAVEVEKEAIAMVNLQDLQKALKNENTLVIDARQTYAFNGWKLNGESRGGHIPGALVFSTEWLDLLADDAAITTELERYAITPDKEIVVYGYGTEDAMKLAEKLQSLSFADVKVFEGGFEAWATDDSLEVAALPGYKTLVHPQWVKDNAADIKLYEVSWGPGDKYMEGHIPGAAHINTDDFEEGPLWNRKSDEEILKSLLSNGIRHDDTIVLYGLDTTAAARIALILEYSGVEDVRLLDGGYKAWQNAGFEIATGGVTFEAVEDFGVTVPQNKDVIIDMPEAKAILATENQNLISIRSWAEFTGETSGYDYIEDAGRIAGAVYGYAGSDPWHMEDYRTPSNTMVNYEYLASRWDGEDIQPEEKNSFYCGTGWRASETWFYAKAMGWTQVSVYDGGWKEWSETEGNPVMTGDPKK